MFVSASHHRQGSWAEGQADARELLLQSSLNDLPLPSLAHTEARNLTKYQWSVTGGETVPALYQKQISILFSISTIILYQQKPK